MKLWNKGIWWAIWGLIFMWAVACRVLIVEIGLEYDEVFTAITSNPALSFGWIISHWLMVDVHPPLHNFILHIWNYFTPYGSEVWLRIPSILFTMGTFLSAWFLFPKRWGYQLRLVFLLFLASNGYMIIYSQHARPYALMLLLSTILTFNFLEISRLVVHKRDIPRSKWMVFGIFSLLLSYSHYFGALLFGIFSVLLFVQAWYHKRPLKWFIAVPVVVFILFLPWLLPNLWTNIGLQRFEGEWWGNEKAWSKVPFNFSVFFFTSFISLGIWIVTMIIGAIYQYLRYRKTHVFAYSRELILLGITLVSVVGIAFLLSIKIHLFFGRYFTEILPAFYIFICLLIAPLARKSNIICLAMTIAFIMAVFVFYREYPSFLKPNSFSARATAAFWRDRFPEQDLLVASMTGYPPASMNAMYGYYLNDVWKKNVKVYELFHIPEEEREAILNAHPESWIYLPACMDKDLPRLAQKWKRSILLRRTFGASCYVQVSPYGDMRPPKEWFR
ncbi:MAG: glycosyltransferase family 39 protein [Elusimicrobiaceae bacterium]|nr:glycosyltransferase family 39 protein [Elusimicrobiaceae bacterium]